MNHSIDRIASVTSVNRAVLATHEPSVFATAVATLYRHAPKVLAANVINAGLVAAILWNRADRSAVTGWVIAMIVMVGVRSQIGRSFHPGGSPAKVAQWARRFTIGSALSGVLWGTGAVVLFSPTDLPAQVLLAFTIGGMAAGASSSVASHLPAFFAFLIPSTLPLIVRFALGEGVFQWGMAAMLGLFALLIAMIGRTTHGTIIESYRLSFVNDALVGRLYDAQRELEVTNADLEARVQVRTNELVEETTVRQAIERQLHHAQKLEALGRLTGGVAHDFNNLLTVIVSALDTVGEERDLGRRADLLRHAKDAALRGGSLTRSLLSFSRRQPQQTEVIDPGSALRRMTRSILRRAVPEAIDLRLQLPDEPLRLKLDVAQFETAVLNLVINAGDAMPSGGPIVLSVRGVQVDDDDGTLAAGAYAELSVSDRGVGIAQATVDRVFEPFFTTKGEAGTGLGLSMVYGFAEQCGGTVRLTSTIGEGTTVRMLLPRIAASTPLPSSPATPHIPRGDGQCVLVVEDEGPVRRLTAISVRGIGYTSLQASTAAQALELLEAHPEIALVLTDIVMPGGMDGVALAHEIQQQWPALPVVLASGYADQSRDVGGLTRLPKPYRRAALAQCLHDALAQEHAKSIVA